MDLSNREISQLRTLSRAGVPLWGGPLTRGQKIDDPEILKWLSLGLIRQMDAPTPGFLITDAGRAALNDIQRSPEYQAGFRDGMKEAANLLWTAAQRLRP